MLSSVREVNEPESGSKTLLQFFPPDSKDSATILDRSAFGMNRKPKLKMKKSSFNPKSRAKPKDAD